MTAQECFSELLNTLRPFLKSAGFTRRGATFSMCRDRNRGAIHFQKSSYSTRDEVRFTLNLEVFSDRVWRYDWGEQIAIAPVDRPAVWCERVGSILPEADDVWWKLFPTQSLAPLVEEMTQRVLPACMEALRSRITDEEIRDLWLERFGRGTLSFDETEWLLALLKALGPPETYTEIAEAFPSLGDETWRRRALRRMSRLDAWSDSS